MHRALRTCLVAVGLTACGGSGNPPAVDGTTATSDAPTPGGADGREVDAPPTAGGDYDQDGPVPYTTAVEHVVNGDQAFDVTVYMPSTPGPHPVVSFACGSTQTAAGYVPYGQRLASHGIAMVLADDPGIFTNTADIVPNAVYVVDTWLPAAHGGEVDLARVGLGGHSRGGAVSLLAAEHGLHGQVVAWFGLDPVDNQFLMTPGEFARTDLASIGIPTGFLGAEVTSNCAPAADSYPTLFPLAPSPKVLVVGVGAGHTQFETASGCTGCTICSPSGTADADVVLAYALRYFTAFFARELLGDTAVGPRFEGAGGPADIAAGRVTIE